ncbi:hypothetical protein BsWGS_24928 [Bradybaena similaris]
MRPVVYLCVFLAVALGVSLGQLITPLQACEMQCMKERGESWANKTAVYECDKVCYQQEYDLLVSLLSSPLPPGLWDTPQPPHEE